MYCNAFIEIVPELLPVDGWHALLQAHVTIAADGLILQEATNPELVGPSYVSKDTFIYPVVDAKVVCKSPDPVSSAICSLDSQYIVVHLETRT